MNRPNPLRRVVACAALATLALPLHATTPQFGIWLSGATSMPSGDGIVNSLNHAFGPGHLTLLSTADLSGSLAAYDTIILSRSGASFGTTTLPASAVTNLQNYVGAFSSPTQGGVALFTNDAKDNFYGSTSGDPFDANLDRLFVNAATFAAATHHGLIGEFNGTLLAINALHLLPGTAGALGGASSDFTYAVGPIGSGHAIDAGITFPFVDGDHSPYLTRVSGYDPATVVDQYTSGSENGLPAVMANAVVISGGETPVDGVPDAANTLGLVLAGVLALAGWKRAKC